jgi:gamma-tubulin complex component 5
MANQPSLKTHEFAYDYLHRQPAQVVDHDRILYDEIMADPFDGPHWGEGYDSEVREGWTDSEDGDEDASSSDKERIITPAKRRVSPVLGHQAQEIGEDQAEIRLREVEEMMRELEAGAYWKRGGEVVQPVKVGQGWREVSTGSNVASLAASLDESIPLGRKVSRRVYSLGSERSTD